MENFQSPGQTGVKAKKCKVLYFSVHSYDGVMGRKRRVETIQTVRTLQILGQSSPHTVILLFERNFYLKQRYTATDLYQL